eukprot:1325521-Pleurochrysis_carterae.AAC.2
MEQSTTVLQVKEAALAQWGAGNSTSYLSPCSRKIAGSLMILSTNTPHPVTTYVLLSGATLPTLQQLRIIHQGRFLSDEKTLKGVRKMTHFP